jgi:hypothetical protein
VEIRAVLALLLLSSSLSAQTQDQSRQPPTQGVKQQSAPAKVTAKIDPAKEADIRRLLDVGGAREAMMEMMAGMEKNIRPLLTNSFPPGEYRERLVELFFEKFHSKVDPRQMLDLAVPVYDKYLSDEEIKGLIEFYSTPLGQKTVKVLPKLMGECAEEGRKWGEKVGRDSMMEVLSEHPELEKAVEDAQKAAQPR